MRVNVDNYVDLVDFLGFSQKNMTFEMTFVFYMRVAKICNFSITVLGLFRGHVLRRKSVYGTIYEISVSQ